MVGRTSIGKDKSSSPARWSGRLHTLAAVSTIATVFFVYAISFGDQGVSFTLVNKTKYFLHVTINNKPYLYASPGSGITYRSDTFSSVVVEAVYSPAQGVTGKALKTFEPVRIETASSQSTCSNQEKDCSTTSAASSVSVSPITWEIHAADLVPD